MAKPKLASLTIYPGAKGHRVVHEFARKPSFSRTSGMGMAAPQQEEHNFGPSENSSLLKHVASALSLGSQPLGSQGQAAGLGGQPEE